MAINPTISDMKWLGEPADLVGNFQKGRNLAEQSQRMKQSADMHPLKMADMKSATSARDANTNLAKQSYEYGQKTMDTKVQAAKYSTNLLGQQVEYGSRTMDSRVSSAAALAQHQQVNADIAKNTQQAVESLKNSQSWNQNRNDEIRKKVKVDLEVSAKEAALQGVVTDQWMKDQSKHDRLKEFKYRTNLLGQQAKAASLSNDLAYNNKALMNENMIAQLNANISANNKIASTNAREEDTRPLTDEAIQGLRDSWQNNDINAVLNSLAPAGISSEQRKRFEAERSAILNTLQGADMATKAATTVAAANAGNSQWIDNLNKEIPDSATTSWFLDPANKMVDENRVPTADGHAALSRLIEFNKIKGNLPKEVVDEILTGYTGSMPPDATPSRASMIRFAGSDGKIAAGEKAIVALQGSLVIPNQNALDELRTASQNALAESRQGLTTTERTWTTRSGDKVTAVPSDVAERESKSASEKRVHDLMSNVDFLDAYVDRASGNYNYDAALQEAMRREDIVGNATYVDDPASLSVKISKGEIEAGDMLYIRDKGVMYYNPNPQQQQQQQSEQTSTQEETDSESGPSVPVHPMVKRAMEIGLPTGPMKPSIERYMEERTHYAEPKTPEGGRAKIFDWGFEPRGVYDTWEEKYMAEGLPTSKSWKPVTWFEPSKGRFTVPFTAGKYLMDEAKANRAKTNK